MEQELEQEHSETKTKWRVFVMTSRGSKYDDFFRTESAASYFFEEWAKRDDVLFAFLLSETSTGAWQIEARNVGTYE